MLSKARGQLYEVRFIWWTVMFKQLWYWTPAIFFCSQMKWTGTKLKGYQKLSPKFFNLIVKFFWRFWQNLAQISVILDEWKANMVKVRGLLSSKRPAFSLNPTSNPFRTISKKIYIHSSKLNNVLLLRRQLLSSIKIIT